MDQGSRLMCDVLGAMKIDETSSLRIFPCVSGVPFVVESYAFRPPAPRLLLATVVAPSSY